MLDAQAAQSGGGDASRAAAAALYEAACLDWRDGAAKRVVFMAAVGPAWARAAASPSL